MTVALVTGASRGIGQAISERLVKQGFYVIGTATSEGGAQAISDRLGSNGEGRVLNVTDAAMVNELAQSLAEADKSPLVLVNNAGITKDTLMLRMKPEDWQAVIDTNLTSAFVCSNAAYPYMKRAGGGKIINIGSMMSIFGASFSTIYAATKGGIAQMARSMATAWAADNIQVNCVLPGWIDTELTQNARRQVDGLHDRVLARTPAGRWGLPGDFCGIAVFLASPASDFLTGTTIPVDGGFSIQG